MAITSSIEWTDASWNPVTGCTEISPGCDHCYARVFAERWRGIPGHSYEQGFGLKLWPERLTLPLSWKKPRRIFVNSMSDLFHKDVPFEFIEQVFQTMWRAGQHTFQVLTKRPKRLLAFYKWHARKHGYSDDDITARRGYATILAPVNAWLGTSIESDAYTWRADYLRKAPAAVRFVSAEPLLSALPSLDLDGIHWLIVGGESGHGARPMHPSWARALRDQCQAAGVAFFFKQHGEWVSEAATPQGVPAASVGEGRCAWVTPTGETKPIGQGKLSDGDAFMYRVGKKAAGRLLDGRTWDEFPVDTSPERVYTPNSSELFERR